MATVLSTLYPPLVDTFMPAFPNVSEAVVNFTVSPYNSSYEIQYLHVTLVNQKTNKNAFGSDSDLDTPAGTALVNGVWIIPFAETLNGNTNPYLDMDRVGNSYTLYIPPTLLKKNEANERKFIVDCYYKVQLRFDKYIDSTDGSTSLTTWNSDYLTEKRAYFSEWSSVCLLKAIPTISLHLNNFTIELDNYLRSTGSTITNLPTNFVVPTRVPQYMPGIIPFAGNLTFEGDNDSGIDNRTKTEYYKRDIKTTSNSEYIASYRIRVLDSLENVKKDSGVLYPAKAEKTNNFYWLCDLTTVSPGSYNAQLTFTTNNQYTFTKTFAFTLVEPLSIGFKPTLTFNKVELPYNGKGHAWKRYDDPSLANYSAADLNRMNKELREDGAWWYEDDNEKVIVTCEDGWVTLTVTHQKNLGAGYLFIKRASSLDGFQNWELIDCSVQKPNSFYRNFIDKTVSSLVAYKYSVQFLTANGNWSSTIISPEIIYPDFHDILLLRGDKQLAIRYNAQIASMTPVVNRVKIDTLGGRYPKFAENAKMHYKQFQLSGMIIAESDYNRKFMDDRYYQRLDPKTNQGYKNSIDIYDNKMGGTYSIRNDTIKEDGLLTVEVEDEEGNIETNTYTNGTYSIDINNPDTDIKLHKKNSQKNTSHDLYPKDNWWWEREFREAAMEWLNDGEPKLYRSMTEGNLIVMIDSISLTPNSQLGRRVWNFSATLYEVGDGNSLQELDSLGIYPITNEYEASFVGNGSVDIDTTVSERRIGQTFSVTAEDTSSGTTIVKDQDFIHPYYSLINNKNQILPTDIDTIGETIGYLYQGLNKNYEFNPDSVRLRDLKIQFESLPQWYDLTAITPEGTVEGAIYFVITDEEGDSYEVYLNNSGEVIRVEGKGNLWDLAGLSITDFFSEWENAIGNQYYVTPEPYNYYVSNSAYNTLYYKVEGNKTIEGKEYLKESFIKSNLYTRNNNEDILVKEIDLSSIEDDNKSSYFIRIARPASQIELNSFKYVPTAGINLNRQYHKIGEKYHYVLDLDSQYLEIDDNYININELIYYWKTKEENSNYVSKDFSKIKLFDFNATNDGWIQDTKLIDFTLLINENTVYYKSEQKYVEQENAQGIVNLVSKTFYNIVSKDEIELTEEYFIKYKDDYLSLNKIYNKDTAWYYDNIELDNHNNEYIYYNEEFTPVPELSTLCYKDINNEYILIKDYNDNNIKLYYLVDSSDPAETSKIPIEVSKVKTNQLYINDSESELSNYIPIYTNTQLPTYYQTTIPVDNYPHYKYYQLTMINLKNPYIYVNKKYFERSSVTEGKDISAGNNLLIVNTDSGESISIPPAEGVEAIDEIVSAQIRENHEKNNYGLGYKLKLNLVSPYDPSVQLERTIFVNERGYYQVPSNMIVKEVTLFDGATATLDYILEYDLNYEDTTEPNSYEAAESIVGQVSGEWKWNTNVTPLINLKYWAYDKEAKTGAITQQGLDSWKAVSFDGTPYTILNIQSAQDIQSERFIVGRSGVLNLQTDYPTTSLVVNGRRMIKAPISRQRYLDEWEYVVDESVYDAIGYNEQEIESGSQYWYIVYNNSGVNLDDWVSSDEVLLDGIPVIIYLSEDIWDETTARKIAEGWYSLKGDIPETITRVELLKPMPNTVYAVANTAGEFDYRIYYLDEGWFNIEFPNIQKKDLSIANARVPVYGMIDYRATILKKFWDPKA